MLHEITGANAQQVAAHVKKNGWGGCAGLQDAMGAPMRDRVYARYAMRGKRFQSLTRRYYSTAAFPFTIEDLHPTTSPTQAFAVLEAGTEIEFFDYGRRNDTRPDGFGGQLEADESDTNLDEAYYTEASRDFAFESLALTRSGHRIQWIAPSTTSLEIGTETIGNEDVALAFRGQWPIDDPGSLMSPPQLASPANLRDVFAEAVKACFLLTLEWDERAKVPLGRLDGLPEGGAKSLLNSGGLPFQGNRMMIPDGQHWRGRGRGDNSNTLMELHAKCFKSIVIPITLPTLLGQSTKEPPLGIAVDFTISLFGEEFGEPSKN
jgi:hypothetical protein